jgi:amino acid adenylation domain-containing protein
MSSRGEAVEGVALPAHNGSARTPSALAVPDLVQAQAARTPDATAVCCGSESICYGTLVDRSARIAARLRSLGVGRDDAVGLCLERSPALVESALGVMQAGAGYLPLDPAHPTPRLTATLEDAGARVVLTDATHCLRFDETALIAVLVEDLLESDATDDLATPSEGMAGPSPDDLAYVIYTSGSTGRPKGVDVTHRSLLNLVRWHQEAFAVTAADCASVVAGPAFDAMVWELWPYLTLGASVTIADEESRLSAETLGEWLLAEGVTISFLPTVLAEAAISQEWPEDTPLRVMLTGGDTLHVYPPPGLPFAVVNNYGPAECTVVTTSGTVSASVHDERLPSIGLPIANVHVHLLDENQRPVPPGDIGEIYVGGEGVARGYRNDPELTAERFVPDPWSPFVGARLYRTGDLSRCRTDGTLEFCGRVDAQVKIRGNRVETDEVAFHLDQHPDVQGSCVVAAPDAAGQMRLSAYLVPAADRTPSRTALAAFLQGRLPDYMVPADFVCLAVLPTTPNGKVDRSALLMLRQAADTNHAGDPPTTDHGAIYVAPTTTVELRIAALASALLKVDRVSVEDDFFLLGGHSLLAAQLIARIRDAFGIEIPLRTIFDHPTARELALDVEDRLLARLEVQDTDEARSSSA